MAELTAVGIDYTKVEPLQQKRVHSFLTQYVSQTACYLNRLSSACEEQLENNGRELQRLDATLCVLESKLASLPDQPQQQQQQQQQEAAVAVSQSEQQQQQQQQQQPAEGASQSQQPAAAASDSQSQQPAAASGSQSAPQQQRVADHPLYASFFKLLKVGVPIPAIKAKMQLTGVDPSVLDLDPDAPAPADAAAGVGGADNGEDDEAEFSD